MDVGFLASEAGVGVTSPEQARPDDVRSGHAEAGCHRANCNTFPRDRGGIMMKSDGVDQGDVAALRPEAACLQRKVAPACIGWRTRATDLVRAPGAVSSVAERVHSLRRARSAQCEGHLLRREDAPEPFPNRLSTLASVREDGVYLGMRAAERPERRGHASGSVDDQDSARASVVDPARDRHSWRGGGGGHVTCRRRATTRAA